MEPVEWEARTSFFRVASLYAWVNPIEHLGHWRRIVFLWKTIIGVVRLKTLLGYVFNSLDGCIPFSLPGTALLCFRSLGSY